MSRPSLDWSDPIAVSRWLAHLRLAVHASDAVVQDMLRPRWSREFEPALHEHSYGEARHRLLQALAIAETPVLGSDTDGNRDASRARFLKLGGAS